MKTEPIVLDVKTVARMINRGLVQTYAAIERGDMIPQPKSRPMKIPVTEVQRFMANMPRRGPKPSNGGGSKKKK